MKINKTKLVVGVLAVAGVASLVGSISGTVAWFQYNTRTSLEFKGTSMKCTEFLEMRTVSTNSGTLVKGKGDAVPTTGTYALNDLFITNDGIVHKCTNVDDLAWDNGELATVGSVYDDGTKLWKKVTPEGESDPHWEELARKEYGEWLTYLDQSAINGLGNSDNFKPITNPGIGKDAALGDFYAQPVAGYEEYTKWQAAKRDDYTQFTLQFRVQDIDGSAVDAGKEALLDKKLFITDFTLASASESGKGDITSALRFHVNDGTNSHLYAKGAADGGDITTKTHGNLNLGGIDRNAPDVVQDIPNNYSFSTGDRAMDDLLDYGYDKSADQVAYNIAKTGVGSIIPTNDGKGHLTGGSEIATTNANTAGTAIADDAYVTLTFTFWLEGWAELGDEPAAHDSVIVEKFVKVLPDVANYDVGEKVIIKSENKIYTVTQENENPKAWDTGVALANGVYYKLATGAEYLCAVSETATTLTYQNNIRSIWNDDTYVGAKFNIGISFGVDTL